MPDVSVLMPVWNGCRDGGTWLREAIDSILDQTLKDIELVVVDDGSEDATPGVLSEYAKKDDRVKVFTLPKNGGIVGAMNHGIHKCRADYIARQDADDISTVTRIEIQKKFLDERPGTAMCGTWMYVINSEGKMIMHLNDRPCGYPVIRRVLRDMCPFVHGSVMYRRAIVNDLGGYSSDKRFQHAEDYELWVRMAKRHTIENIPGKTLYFHRNHDTKISTVHSRQQETASKLIMDIARRTLI